MNNCFKNVIWAFVLAVLVIGGIKTNALFSFEESSPEKPRIIVSPPPSKTLLNQTVSLTISCTWEGEEGRFRFILPADFKLINLRYLKTGESSEIKGREQVKRFTYEFEPIQLGNAKIDTFSLVYQSKDQPEAMISHPIDAMTIKVIPNSPSLGTWVVRGLRIAFFPALATLLFLIAKRQVKPIESTSALSLETRKLDELSKLSLMIKDPGFNLKNILVQLVQILESFKIEKWRNQSNDSALQRHDMNHQKNIDQLLETIERYQFGGAQFQQPQAEEILARAKSLIAQHQIYEPSQKN